jgi:hypothetical protein
MGIWEKNRKRIDALIFKLRFVNIRSSRHEEADH